MALKVQSGSSVRNVALDSSAASHHQPPHPKDTITETSSSAAAHHQPPHPKDTFTETSPSLLYSMYVSIWKFLIRICSCFSKTESKLNLPPLNKPTMKATTIEQARSTLSFSQCLDHLKEAKTTEEVKQILRDMKAADREKFKIIGIFSAQLPLFLLHFELVDHLDGLVKIRSFKILKDYRNEIIESYRCLREKQLTLQQFFDGIQYGTLRADMGLNDNCTQLQAILDKVIEEYSEESSDYSASSFSDGTSIADSSLLDKHTNETTPSVENPSVLDLVSIVGGLSSGKEGRSFEPSFSTAPSAFSFASIADSALLDEHANETTPSVEKPPHLDLAKMVNDISFDEGGLSLKPSSSAAHSASSFPGDTNIADSALPDEHTNEITPPVEKPPHLDLAKMVNDISFDEGGLSLKPSSSAAHSASGFPSDTNIADSTLPDEHMNETTPPNEHQSILDLVTMAEDLSLGKEGLFFRPSPSTGHRAPSPSDDTSVVDSSLKGRQTPPVKNPPLLDLEKKVNGKSSGERERSFKPSPLTVSSPGKFNSRGLLSQKLTPNPLLTQTPSPFSKSYKAVTKPVLFSIDTNPKSQLSEIAKTIKKMQPREKTIFYSLFFEIPFSRIILDENDNEPYYHLLINDPKFTNEVMHSYNELIQKEWSEKNILEICKEMNRRHEQFSDHCPSLQLICKKLKKNSTI